MMHEADICEIITISPDSRDRPEIHQVKVDDVDALIDRARFYSRNTYSREVLAVVNALTVARFMGRYWLDNPDALPEPSSADNKYSVNLESATADEVEAAIEHQVIAARKGRTERGNRQ